MSASVNLLIKEQSERPESVVRSQGILPMNPNEVYDLVPICKCSANYKKKAHKMTERTRASYQEIMKILQEKFGELKVVSIGRGEGSFGVSISVSTKDDKNIFIIKTQKCQTCQGKTTHAKSFMKEVNAINKVIKDTSYEFLMPYICAYFPTQKQTYWFDDHKNNVIELNPNRKNDAISLGLIVMKMMEKTMIIQSEERYSITNNTIIRGGWLSFVWSGSLLGIISELVLSGSFHGDLKEENIVGERIIKEDPFSYIWKAIDFGGAGNASSETDLAQSMYTPHYQPIKSISVKNITNRDYAWIHDILALAHIVRNMCSFMTSTTRRVTPYSGKNSVERFFMTSSEYRNLLTNRVLKELPKEHRGIKWCKEWIQMLQKSSNSWKDFNTIQWCLKSLKSWLRCCDTMLDVKPSITKRVGIVKRLKSLVVLLKRLKQCFGFLQQ